MPRIRAIYPSFKHDAGVKRCSRDARLTFLLMLTEADDEGRMPGSGKWLAGTLFEDDEDATPAKVLRWVAELVEQGMVTPYEVEGCKYLHVTKFSTYQHPKNPGKSRLPAPPSTPGSTPGSTPDSGGGTSLPPTPVPTPATNPLSGGLDIERSRDQKSSSSESDSRPPPTGVDDDDGILDETTEAALTAAGRARLGRREAEKGQVGDHGRWLAADRRRSLAALAKGDRSVLDPPAPAPNGTRPLDPTEATAAARRAEIERNEARRRGASACETCADSGVYELEDGSVERCNCAEKRASA